MIGIFAVCCSLPCAAQVLLDAFPLQLPAAPVPASSISDYRTAVDAIVWTLVHRFDLPAPEGRVEVYASKAAFEAGLMKHLSMSPELARTTAEFAKAGVGNYTVLINEPVMAPLTWPRRIEELAHELTHSVELTLVKQPVIAHPHWLIEAFAEWMGYNVTDAMGLDRLPDVRTRLLQRVKAAKSKDGLPDLTRINTLPQWIEARKKYGFDGTYSLSFLAMDFLIARHSVAKVTDFFRQYRLSQNDSDNFRAAFGEEVAEFGNALDAHLARTLAEKN